MRALKICLWIAGILCLLGVFGMFLPISVWESIAKFFGIESLHLPDSPLVEYAVRLMSATSVTLGVYFIILAQNPMRYGIMVPFTGLAAIFLGVACAITGLVAKMPVWWPLADSITCTILGALILVFWRQAQQTSRPLTDTM